MNKIRKVSLAKLNSLLKRPNLLSFNRDIVKGHVVDIQKSVISSGILRLPLLADVSIFDDRKVVIADGQHLVSAITLLPASKRPEAVQCLVKKYSSKAELIADIARLNNTAKSWGNEDYLNAWYKYGKDNIKHFSKYAHLYNMKESCFKTLSMGNLIDLYAPGGKETFRKGALTFRDQTLSDNLGNVLDKLHIKHIDGANTLTGVIKWAWRMHADKRDIDLVKLESRIISAINNNEISRRESRDDMIEKLDTVYNRV